MKFCLEASRQISDTKYLAVAALDRGLAFFPGTYGLVVGHSAYGRPISQVGDCFQWTMPDGVDTSPLPGNN